MIPTRYNQRCNEFHFAGIVQYRTHLSIIWFSPEYATKEICFLNESTYPYYYNPHEVDSDESPVIKFLSEANSSRKLQVPSVIEASVLLKKYLQCSHDSQFFKLTNSFVKEVVPKRYTVPRETAFPLSVIPKIKIRVTLSLDKNSVLCTTQFVNSSTFMSVSHSNEHCSLLPVAITKLWRS